MAKQNVTLSIDAKTWQSFQIHCLKQDKIPSREIEQFMKDQSIPKDVKAKMSEAEREAQVIRKLLARATED